MLKTGLESNYLNFKKRRTAVDTKEAKNRGKKSRDIIPLS